MFRRSCQHFRYCFTNEFVDLFVNILCPLIEALSIECGETLIIVNCRTRVWRILHDPRNDKCLLVEFSGGEFHRRCSLNVLISDDELARRALIN